DRGITMLLDVIQRKKGVLLRRSAAALLSRIAYAPTPALIGACVALEPMVLGFAGFPVQYAADAATGLIRHGWPVHPTTKQINALLAVPWVRSDLAVAAAVAGLYSG